MAITKLKPVANLFLAAILLPGLGWLAPPKSTRVWEPTLSWNQLHSEPPRIKSRGMELRYFKAVR